MFEFLFNEPLAAFGDARLELEGPFGAAGLAGAVAVAVLLVALSLARRPLSGGRRAALFALQGAVAAAVLTMLWRPALERESVGPGENRVAWLLDASASMATPDADGANLEPPGATPAAGEGRTRLAAARDALVDEGLLDDEDFEHVVLALGDGARALESPEAVLAVAPDAPLTDIGGAVTDLLDAVDERALAAIVLLSDGADNAGAPDAAWWRRVAAAGVPVHTVGVGATVRGPDVELVDVRVPERAAADATVTAVLRIAHAPDAPPVRVRVTTGSTLLVAEDLTLASGADETVHAVHFDAGDARLAELRFAIDAGAADPQPANDAQVRVLDVRETPRRVLYLEGEPRWEFKFIRRALADEAGVEIVSLLRTSPNKFYRQGVRDADELADGFPATREALYEYDGVIIGSVEAALLNPTQQAALRDFVAVRGGGLLMLGGRSGLADGGWARSAVAVALPTVLPADAGSETFERTRTRVLPTRHGLRTDWFALGGANADAADAQAVLDSWSDLPELADRQAAGRPKPGAVVLLQSDAGDPVLVRQRYGRGTSWVLASSGTWRWQMGLPSEDRRHEDFWRGLVGTLAGSSPARLDLRPAEPVVRDLGTGAFAVEARAADWTPLAREALQASLVRPDGAREPAELVADPELPGRWLVNAALSADGPWGLELTAVAGGESPAGPPLVATAWTVHESGTAEAFGGLQHQRFLERLADVTGGSYTPIDDVRALPERLAATNAALTRIERSDLWNAPAFFLLILGFKSIEWLLRLRWRRL